MKSNMASYNKTFTFCQEKKKGPVSHFRCCLDWSEAKFNQCNEAGWQSGLMLLANQWRADAVIPLRQTLQLVGGMWWHITSRMENTADKVIISTMADSLKLWRSLISCVWQNILHSLHSRIVSRALFVSTNSSLSPFQSDSRHVSQSLAHCNTQIKWMQSLNTHTAHLSFFTTTYYTPPHNISSCNWGFRYFTLLIQMIAFSSVPDRNKHVGNNFSTDISESESPMFVLKDCPVRCWKKTCWYGTETQRTLKGLLELFDILRS